MNAKIEKEIKAIEAKNDAMNKDFVALQEQRADLDRQMSEIRTEQVRFQGRYQALTEMLEPDKKTKS